MSKRGVPAQIMPTNLPSSKKRRTRCCTGELVEMVSAPFAPPGITSKSYLSYAANSTHEGHAAVDNVTLSVRRTGVHSCGEKYMSGRMLMPRDPCANGGALKPPLLSGPAATNAEAQDTPARTRVS